MEPARARTTDSRVCWVLGILVFGACTTEPRPELRPIKLTDAVSLSESQSRDRTSRARRLGELWLKDSLAQEKLLLPEGVWNHWRQQAPSIYKEPFGMRLFEDRSHKWLRFGMTYNAEGTKREKWNLQIVSIGEEVEDWTFVVDDKGSIGELLGHHLRRPPRGFAFPDGPTRKAGPSDPRPDANHAE